VIQVAYNAEIMKGDGPEVTEAVPSREMLSRPRQHLPTVMVRIGLKEGHKVFAVVLAFAAFELAANAREKHQTGRNFSKSQLFSQVILCESAAHGSVRSCPHQDRSDNADHQYG
jgi:hypothetical protein